MMEEGSEKKTNDTEKMTVTYYLLPITYYLKCKWPKF